MPSTSSHSLLDRGVADQKSRCLSSSGTDCHGGLASGYLTANLLSCSSCGVPWQRGSATDQVVLAPVEAWFVVVTLVDQGTEHFLRVAEHFLCQRRDDIRGTPCMKMSSVSSDRSPRVSCRFSRSTGHRSACMLQRASSGCTRVVDCSKHLLCERNTWTSLRAPRAPVVAHGGRSGHDRPTVALEAYRG